MKKFLAGFILLLGCLQGNAQDTTQQVIKGRKNASSQLSKPYVILISADGFRFDLAEKFHAKNILSLASTGVKAAYLQPSYPTLTFPNHYSIVTGLYPAHHGLVDNNFFDRHKSEAYEMSNKTQVKDSSWYGGMPLWSLAESQGLLSASFYWVASEAAIQGYRPTYYYKYNEQISIDSRLNVLKSWLNLPDSSRPHLITFYFPQVDHELHLHGTNSQEAAEAVKLIDSTIGKMSSMISALQLNVNYIFVSDHGMTDVDLTHTLTLPSSVDTSKFFVPYGAAMLQLYAKNKIDIKPLYKKLKNEANNYRVYLKKDLPERWHFGKKDDRYDRIGDIILCATPPFVFQYYTAKTPNRGQHGYDNHFEDMRASFYAWGPAFKNLSIPGFENVNIFPLICSILGLSTDFKIDGDLKVLSNILK